jgi:hypothetical protein
MRLETLDSSVRDYIRELETNLQEYQYKYLEIKERSSPFDIQEIRSECRTVTCG